VADAALPPPEPPALTECRRAWFGLAPLVMNPTFTNVDDLDKLAQGVEGVEWTHWADLVNIYGTDELGFARVPWDNVGVQYGLQALRDGVITAEEFLHLNANVGSWKESRDLATEGFPFVGDVDPRNFDPWSSRNMNLSPDGGSTPAPRREGDLDAIAAAYRSGMVFTGRIDIPVIDWRHYLEHELDMHHTHPSFATRQRLIEGRGDADNQVIWFTDARPARAFDRTGGLRGDRRVDGEHPRRPERGVALNRPPGGRPSATSEGEEIARAIKLMGRHLERPALRALHRAVRDPSDLAHGRGRPDPGRRLQVPAPDGRPCDRRGGLRMVGADARPAGAALGDLPGRRV
jgi:hypothetical protein